jgi:hypothetical protein
MELADELDAARVLDAIEKERKCMLPIEDEHEIWSAPKIRGLQILEIRNRLKLCIPFHVLVNIQASS